MDLTTLSAIAPIDGRYRNKTQPLASYFSEWALIKYRVHVEVEYFIALCELPLPQLKDFDHSLFPKMRELASKFSEDDALVIKKIEKTTNHDVKAVEYFIKDHFDKLGLEAYKEFIHFGLTSQDINNTSNPLMLKHAHEKVVLPQLQIIIDSLKKQAEAWKDIPMLARTHGQPASPTRLGKEVDVFIERLERQIKSMGNIPFGAKFGGATGNFNAHHVAYPNTDWVSFANNFINDTLDLQRYQTTTQIEHYDYLSEYFHAISRVNTILMDLSKDVWQYVSANYFKQKVVKGEIGSSAMPHKVNPIDFENAEGNLGIANAILAHLAQKLPVSRLQRDLTDSTVLRNVGVPLAHMLISFASIQKGLGKLEVNEANIRADLDKNWAVVAEAIQTILRREAYPNPYEALKDLTRGYEINETTIQAFIEKLDVSDAIKTELKAITPFNYTGL
jgi:adenylosuccinate lyase